MKQTWGSTQEERKDGIQTSEPIIFWNFLEIVLWVEKLLLAGLLLSFLSCFLSFFLPSFLSFFLSSFFLFFLMTGEDEQ